MVILLYSSSEAAHTVKVWWMVTKTWNRMFASLQVHYLVNSLAGKDTMQQEGLEDGQNPKIMDDLFHGAVTTLCRAKMNCWYKGRLDIDWVE